MVRSDPKAWVGKTVGGIYRIQRHVASGGFADVYQAWHEELDTPVALKMRRPVQAGAKSTDAQRARNDDYAFAHFKTEAVLGFRLRDPHVVRVLDFRLEATAEYLVMEWLEGQSLRDIQNGRPMYWRRAAELTAAASEAVASLHASGWFHRDIKPDNFMVVGEGGEERVVLIDLGLVRHRPLAEPIMSQLAEPTADYIPHTPGYCAPEVYARSGQPIDESPFTEASEVFALGVTLFKLLTGRFPWPGNTAEQQQVEIALGVPPMRPSQLGHRLPGDLENLVMRAIGTDPSHRPASAAEFGQQLRSLLSPSRPAEARPTARAPEPTPPSPITPVTGLRAPVSRSPAVARSSTTTARPPVVAAGPVAMGASGSRFGVVSVVGAVLAVLVLLVTLPWQQLEGLPVAARLQPLPEPITTSPGPTLVPVVIPEAEAPGASAVPAVPPAAPPARSKRQRVERALRGCPNAPAGIVMVEVRDGQVQTIELEPFIAADPWHACAARHLRGLADGGHALKL